LHGPRLSSAPRGRARRARRVDRHKLKCGTTRRYLATAGGGSRGRVQITMEKAWTATETAAETMTTAVV
jgi:hypothetical protein